MVYNKINFPFLKKKRNYIFYHTYNQSESINVQ